METQSSPIRGGDLVAEGEYEAVGALYITSDDGDSICTASLITPNQILTAAHCLDDFDTAIFITGDNNVLEGPISGTDVQSVILHPDYATEPIGNDVAVATLEASLSITPLRVSAGGIPLVQDQELTQVGFGHNDTEGEGEDRADSGLGVKRVADGVRFDRMISDGKELLIDPSDEDQLGCGGDSGGPVMANGYIVGVHAAGFTDPSEGSFCQANIESAATSTEHVYDFIAEHTTLSPRIAQRTDRPTPDLPLTGDPDRGLLPLQHGDQRPTLIWTDYFLEYDVQVNRVRPTSLYNVHRGRTYGDSIQNGRVHFKLPNALPCATYRYRYAAFGDVSLYTFAILDEPTDAVFTWASVPDAKRYEIIVHKVNTNGGGNEVPNIFRYTTTDLTQVETTTPLPAGTYRFKVRAISNMSRYKWFEACP